MTSFLKTTFIITLALLISSKLLAQDINVSGVVYDEKTGEKLIGANISIGKKYAVSGLDGRFTIAMNPGSYILNVSYVGYNDYEHTLELQTGGSYSYDIRLVYSENILKTATVTGSKHEKELGRSPVSISVIKPELIENTNTIRITSLLDKIPGVQIIDNQANIRGGSGWSYGAGSRVLLLIDDVPAFQADAGRPSWGDIPVENISQIEVLKGASSTLYGSAALNGIINIRTGYATSEPVTKASLSYKSYMSPKDEKKKWWTDAPNKWTASVVHKQKFGNLDLVANAFYEDFDSYYQDAYEQKGRASANLKYRFSDRITLGVNTMLNISNAADYFLWGNGGADIYKGLDGTLSARDNQRFYIDPNLSIYDLKGNRHKLFGRYYYINNDNNANQSNSSKSFYGEYQFSTQVKAIEAKLTTGAVAYFTTSDSELFGDVLLKHNNYAGYFELDKSFGDKFTMTAGMRLEHHVQKSPEVFKGDTIPNGRSSESKLISRLGLNYKLTEGTFLRGSWGQGYRYPTIVERFIETAVGSFYVFPNTQLQSESGWSTELGIKQGIKIQSWEGFLDLSFFWSKYSNMTEFSLQEDTDTGRYGFQSQNVGATDIKGFEVDWVGRSKLWGVPINILAGYTYLDPKYSDFENNEAVLNSISIPVGEDEKRNVLKYRNQHNFKMDVEAIFGKLSAGVAYNYTSETVTIDQLLGNISQIRLYREANPGGFSKLDTRVAYNMNWFKCTLVVENLLNEEITLRPGLLEAPRAVSLRLDFNI